MVKVNFFFILFNQSCYQLSITAVALAVCLDRQISRKKKSSVLMDITNLVGRPKFFLESFGLVRRDNFVGARIAS